MTLQHSTGFNIGAVTIILCSELQLRHIYDIALSAYDGYNIPNLGTSHEVSIIMLNQCMVSGYVCGIYTIGNKKK